MMQGAAHRMKGARWPLLLVACALLLRMVVPAGWMPQAGATGVTLSWCDESGTRAAVPEEAKALLAKAIGKSDHKQTKVGDGPCAFAGAAQALTFADAIALPLPAVEAATILPTPLSVSPGCGLAAPPPHSTGPPTLA